MFYKFILAFISLFITIAGESTSTNNIQIMLYEPTYFEQIEDTIKAASLETNVPAKYIRGIVKWECGNDLSLEILNKNGTVDLGPGLNSRWIKEYEWRFNKGKQFDPHSLDSIYIVARILANNHKVFNNWDWTLTSYRWGVNGAIMNGIDYYYVINVKAAGK